MRSESLSITARLFRPIHAPAPRIDQLWLIHSAFDGSMFNHLWLICALATTSESDP